MTMYRMGKLPKKTDYRTLKFKKYITDLEEPPETYDILEKVYKNCKNHDPAVLFPTDGNDIYGDCTIAAAAHAITVWRCLISKKSIMSRNAVVKLYFHLTGGNDTGLYALDVLNYWRKTAINTEKILSFVAIDPKNHTHIKQATKLFGGVYLGFQCQENCVEDFKAGKPWTPGPLENAGHMVWITSYDETYVTVLTWGGVQKATYDWMDECCDEAYAILPMEAKKPGFAEGFNFKQLQEDLDKVANST
jgi:hypothetical protein